MPASSSLDPARPDLGPRPHPTAPTPAASAVEPDRDRPPRPVGQLLGAVLPLTGATAGNLAASPPRPAGGADLVTLGSSGTYVPLEAPLALPARVDVQPWVDPVLEQFGHDARSAYVERFWLAILGPSATLLLRHLAHRFDDHPNGFELDLEDTARVLGIGSRQQTGAPMGRVVERVIGFGFVRLVDDRRLDVRRRLPSLTRRQVQRLPRRVQRVHDEHIEAAQRQPAPAAVRRRAMMLAATLLDLGEGPGEAELQLQRWNIHPALAYEAVQWALTDRDPRAHGLTPTTETATVPEAEADDAPPDAA